MATIQTIYMQGIRKQLGDYFAAWLPNADLNLGDVGELLGPVFTRTTSLKDLGVDFVIRPDRSPTPLDLVSSSGVSLKVKASGQLSSALPKVPEAEAGIEITFGRKGAFVVEARESFEPGIESITAVDEEIRRLDAAGKWDRNWAVITQIVECPRATILVAQSHGAAVQLSGKCPGVPTIQWLGDIGGKLSVSHSRGAMIRLVDAEQTTPMFRLRRLRPPLGGRREPSRIERHAADLDRAAVAPTAPTASQNSSFDFRRQGAEGFRGDRCGIEPSPEPTRSRREAGQLSLQPIPESDIEWT